MREFYVRSGAPDPNRKACKDCRFLKGAVSLWCKNEDAVKWRGTAIPGVYDCQFWQGMRTWSELSLAEKASTCLPLSNLIPADL